MNMQMILLVGLVFSTMNVISSLVNCVASYIYIMMTAESKHETIYNDDYNIPYVVFTLRLCFL